MICHQFDEISTSEDFVNMSVNVLKGILARNDVSADEGEIFECVKRWISHDETKRLPHVDDLLSLIRFPTIKRDKLARLDEDPFMAKSKILRAEQLHALKYLACADVAEDKDSPKYMFRWFSNINQKWEYSPGKEEIHSYEIPANGYYRFIAAGAKALDGTNKKGGRGAIISATFFLKRGDKLEILVGGMSKLRSSDTGGGGGTFVAINGRMNPLIVAGGGGGTRGATGDEDGRDASLTEAGNDGAGTYHSKGATAGEGATGCTSSYGGGGGGYFSDGKPNGGGTTPGIGFMNGGRGGGYSGGGAGQGAGGGGSYIRADGADIEKSTESMGEGYLVITAAKRPSGARK
eukprot:TRINITY_DN1701_c0_g2_i3.p1 TRINITY_DN1701_c0_g2~~TRINITY_DN1701_c0_g2_i3.p1  ORF type:complete len:373 (+),score=85.50 TRINITY_DN1701_c0_g2_i3:77-1120(+)